MWCVLDIETTGLDPKKDLILEVGLIVVKPSDLSIVWSWRSNVLHGRTEIDARMGDYVRSMHTRNGLLTEIASGEGMPLASMDQTLEFNLAFHRDPTAKVVLIGNSIHFDRSFVDEQLPIFASVCHYRMIDVSTLNTLRDEWKPGSRTTARGNAHRALPDCMESLEQLREHRSSLWA